jgi:hypothetical protein
MSPEICPHCGAEVPSRAKACPECGADETTGWSERASSDRLGLPDEEFDYGEFARREFGGGEPDQRPGRRWWWRVVAGVLLLLLLAGFIL